MKIVLALVAISFLIVLQSNAQTYELLRHKIVNADTIVLATHKNFRHMVDSAGHDVLVPEWVVKGHPNYKALHKYRIVTPIQRLELSRILLRPFQDKVVSMNHCFMPHHILFLVKNSKTSFTDICFDCRQFRTSHDLNRLDNFDNRKWRELEAFFNKLGLSYNGF